MSTAVTDDDTFKVWDGWLDKIYDEVTELSKLRYMFQEIGKLVDANPQIQKPNPFYSWMGQAYGPAVAIGIRRLVDEDSRSTSLVRLLRGIIRQPEVLSRSRYRAIWTKAGGEPSDITDATFDSFAGKGNEIVDLRGVQGDLDSLIERARLTSQYATRAVAHSDQRGPSGIPTFNDIDECLNLLEELTRKYFLLFRAVKPIDILPTWQGDWKEIFRVPWIPS